MTLAKDLWDRVEPDANVELERDDYRLSLNPIKDRPHELGFIIWQAEAGGLTPVASGRAVGDDVVIDDGGRFDSDRTGLEQLLRDLLDGQPVAVSPRPVAEQAVPTGA